ncbi:RHS repeat-associated core domain-containing protein [Pseudomonas putida]|uniref:RHS repeat-associated core domain-containing protein n=1 Tax=Pseudomonas putida TaxID=303 RepID=UPI003905C0DD
MPEIPTSPQRASEALLSQGDGVSNIHVERSLRQRQWSFGPYGQLPPQGAVGGLRFVGQWFDPVVQGYLLGNGHRLYRPSIMRFLTFDSLSPFGAGGINGYAYCSGDPVNYHDPSGRAKYGLTQLLAEKKLPKQPLRAYLKPLGRPENYKKTRWVYQLEGDKFKTFEFMGGFRKVVVRPGDDLLAVWESIKGENYYTQGKLYIKQSTVPEEGIKQLESAGFKLIKFDTDTFAETVFQGAESAPAQELTRHNLHSPANVYIEDPTVEGANIRSVGHN